MELYIAGIWLVLAAYFGWRLYVCVKKLLPIDHEITSLIYLLMLGGLSLISLVLPTPPRTVVIVVLIVCAVIATAISYRLNRKYRVWQEEKLEERKRLEEAEKYVDWRNR